MFAEENIDVKDMTLRDYFAANERSEPPIGAMHDSAKFCGISQVDYNKLNPWERRAMYVTRWRYMCADAMLAERKNKS